MRISLPNDFVPRPYQQRFMKYLDDGGRHAFWCVHRRAGKDLTALHQMCKMAHERVGLYWHCLPTYSQARKVVWNGFRNDGKRFIDNVFPSAIVAAKNEQSMRIDLKCGSVVQIVGSDNHDSLVGSNPIGVTFSEYALNKPSAYNYIRPILAANGGWVAWITTPRGRNFAYDLWKVAQQTPGWFAETQGIYDTQALPASIIDEERAAGMPDALIRSEYLCDWDAALIGSIWGEQIEELAKRGGLDSWQPETGDIFTAWDLGMSDSTAIWFFRVAADGVEFIDHYEAHGKPLSHYADEVERRGFGYVRHWLPHDANARHLGTEATVLEQLQRRFGSHRVAIGPRMALLDGIQAGRWLLQQKGTRFHPACAKGVEALRAYHYEYDEDDRTYGSKPAHDWSSHTADAFRYAAVVARVSGIYKPAPKPGPRQPPVFRPAHHTFTLEQLYEDAATRRVGRKRL